MTEVVLRSVNGELTMLGVTSGGTGAGETDRGRSLAGAAVAETDEIPFRQVTDPAS